MKPRQTTVATPSHLAQGWLSSLALHGFLLCAVIVFARQSPITLSTERFQWDVTLVQSTQPPESALTATSTTAQPIREMSAPPPTTAHRPPQTGTPYNKTVRTVQPVVAPKGIEEPTPKPRSSMNQTASPSETTITDAAPIPPSTAERLQPAVASSDPHVQEPPTAEAPTANFSPIPDSPRSSVEPSPSEAATATPVATVSSPLPDYGWLQQAIFQRLEELKRTSRPQVDQTQPLKVLVKAVVSREGVLLDSMVVKSSGLDRIDQEAISLVQRAFPMQLDRPLNRQQVAMRIPITYSRE